MTKGEKRQYILENLIYLIIWLTIFLMPVLQQRYDTENTFQWSDIFRTWRIIVPFFLLFLINNYLLIPRFLIPKKLLLYLLLTIGLVGGIYLIRSAIMPKRPQIENRQPIHEPPPPGNFPRDGFSRDGFRPKENRPPMFPFPFRMPPFVNFALMGLLVIGLNIAIKLLFKSLRDDHRMKELEKHNLQTELEYLKHQINPHFFMNTLNNIHALIDIDTEKAKDTVLELSKMMRYVLYDAAQTSLPLSKEIQFLKNYIELMKIRYTDKVEIRVSFPEDVPDVRIPPLLFISFIENAFKHGISYQQASVICFRMEIKDNELHGQIINSSFDNAKEQYQGIGLDNVRKRLRLLYGDTYTLHINSDDETYNVLLIIPLQT